MHAFHHHYWFTKQYFIYIASMQQKFVELNQSCLFRRAIYYVSEYSAYKI